MSGGGSSVHFGSGVGRAFIESLKEMYTEKEINQDQFTQGIQAFDKIISDQLSKVDTHVTLEGKVAFYRYDSHRIWTFVVKNASIVGVEGEVRSKELKILASEAKNKGKKIQQ